MANFFASVLAFIKAHTLVTIITVVVVGGAVATPIIINVINDDSKPKVRQNESIGEVGDESKEESTEESTEKKEESTTTQETTQVVQGEQPKSTTTKQEEKKTEPKKEESTKKEEPKEEKPVKEDKKEEPQSSNTDEDYSDAKGSIDMCMYEPDSEECKREKLSSHFSYSTDGYSNHGIYYENQKIISYTSDVLERCYDAYSCVNQTYATYYEVNESIIKSMPKEHKDYMLEEYTFYINFPNVVAKEQAVYDEVVKHNYYGTEEKLIEEYRTAINKYSDYKDKNELPEEVCMSDNKCYNYYAYMESELYWLENEYYPKSKRDLEKITKGLESAKRLYNALYN